MEKLIAALARCRNVPFSRQALRGMDRDQVATVAKGALRSLPADSDAFREILTAQAAAAGERVEDLAAFAEDVGADGGEEIDVRVRNVMSGPRGSAVLDRPEERDRFESRNRDGESDGVDVDVRSIMSGRRGEAVLDD